MGNVDQNEAMSSGEMQPYEVPVLRVLGDVRQLTLGGSTGSGDSGNPANQQF